MSEFSFQEKKRLCICGRTFELSPLDSGYLESLLQTYLQILRVQDQYEQAQNLLQSSEVKPEQVRQAGQSILQANQTMLFCARQFLQTALGEDAYQDIFRTRPANVAEHLQLCTFLMEELLPQEDEEESLEALYDSFEP